MSTADIIREGSRTDVLTVADWDGHGERYQVEVALCPEDEGGFSAHATNLPGAVSEGDTEAEALDNIREACAGVIKTCLARDGKIHWGKVVIEDCDGMRTFRIIVNV